MLLIRANARPSPIDRLGLFADEHVPAGACVWEFRPGFDVALTETDLAALHPASREQVTRHAFFDVASGRYILSSDDDRFLNHSPAPNLTHRGLAAYATRDIAPGEELCTDYAEWGADAVPVLPVSNSSPCKHGWMVNGYANLFIGRSPFGWGLFAARDFAAGEAIFTFTGPILSHAETRALGSPWSFYPLQVAKDRYIDCEPPGALINHSCEPNSGVRENVHLVALRDIRAGEELTFDYSCQMSEEDERMTCGCGSAECRGVVGDFHELPRSLQERYLSLGIVSDFIVAECSERTNGNAAGTTKIAPPRVTISMRELPKFPAFAPLSFAHKAPLQEITARFPAYADASFASLWSFDDGLPSVALLRRNLVLRLTDPGTGQRYTTLFGDEEIDATLDELAEHDLGLPESLRAPLRAVPEEVARASQRNWQPERDAFEYVFDITEWQTTRAGDLPRRRHRAERFAERHPRSSLRRLNLSDRATCSRMEDLAADVMQQKGMLDRSLLAEQRALVRCLAAAPALGCIGYGVELGDALAAFTLLEPLSGGWYHAHFVKTNREVAGLMEFVTLRAAHEMRQLGSRYLNDHEDLGLPGLRRVKESWAPARFLKRYRLSG